MSLILDALNKADRERQDSESPPGLQSHHNFFAGPEKMAGWKKTLVILAVALVLAAAAIAYHLGKRSSSSPPAAGSEVTQTTPPAPVAEPARRAQAEPAIKPTPPVTQKIVPPANTAARAAGQTAETRTLLQKRRIEEQYKKIQATKEKSLVATAGEKSEKASDSISALYQPTENQTLDSQTPDNQPSEQPSTAGNRSSTPDNEPANDVPIIGSVRDLPWSAQEKIPTLMYTEHRFTDSPNDYVTINGERKTKGQKIANILTVDSILEDGVILRYENHQFKMPALNSWINM